MELLDRIKEDYFSYEGRLNRKPYIIRYLILLTIMFLGRMLITPNVTITFGNVIATIVLIICTISIIMLDIRRLHDLGKKWYWVLLMLIPGVNILFLLYLALSCGYDSENEYGSRPL